MANLAQSPTPRQPLAERVLTTGVIRRRNPFWPPIRIAEADLTALIDEHDLTTPETTGHAGAVLDQLGVDYDGAPDAHDSNRDVVHLACVIVALSATVAKLRATSVVLEDVPAQSLRDALAEVSECVECHAAPCHCWAFDETLEAPVDVHPANRAQEAAAIRWAVDLNRKQRAAS